MIRLGSLAAFVALTCGSLAQEGGGRETAATPSGPVLRLGADRSLHRILPAIIQAWADGISPAPQVDLQLADPATLRNRIENDPGAWDLVILADAADVEVLTQLGRLDPGTTKQVAKNRVVILGRAPLVADEELEWFDLAAQEWGSIGLGDATMTVSGRLARAALDRRKLNAEAHRQRFRLAKREDLILDLLRRNQVDAVFLLETEAGRDKLPGYRIFALDDAEAHPVPYIASVLTQTQARELAASLFQFLARPEHWNPANP
jgi:ABC-type molybdate transport system substrate-binding protein